MSDFEYSFPSIRGIQAGREYYVSMCPLKFLPKMFIFDDDDLPPDMRAQRVLNKGRLPEIVRYLRKNTSGYVFSAITASIDGEIRFDPIVNGGPSQPLGTLRVPMSARILINDGQHRRAAIEQALKDVPDLKDETIPIVFFLDIGLERSQQMFADLNRYTVRPTRSLSILYDHRDEWSKLSKAVIREVPVFKELTETARSSISNRSVKLFTLSGIYSATVALLEGRKQDPVEERIRTAVDFWKEVSKQIPDWGMAKERKVSSAELRRDYIHSHALALLALGHAGRCLMEQHPKAWKQRLDRLKKIDWLKSNRNLWEGRAMIGGRLQKGRNNVVLTTAILKEALGLPLNGEEQRLFRHSAEQPLREKRNRVKPHPERRNHVGTSS